MLVAIVTCRIKEDSDERDMLVYGYKFKLVLGTNYGLIFDDEESPTRNV